MKRYSKYKDSNSEWIGEIPEHWECTRLVNLGTFTASGIDKKINEDEELVKIINFTDIYSNSSNLLNSKRDYMEVTAPSYKVEEHQVKKGDLLFLPSSETFEDLGLSALVDEDLPNTAFSYHVIRLQFDKPFDHRFKKYLANNYNLLNYFSSEGKGTTRKILNRDSFKDACVVVPPLPEQTQISSYLDNKTSLIDKLINNNKKLIKLLDEKRTALINKVITKGLDPNVKMRDSGIEWIGEIPEHWEVKRLKYLTQLLTERTRKNQNLNKVALENVQSKTTRYVETDSEFQADGISFKKGDLLFGKLRPYLVKIWVAEFAGSAVGDFFVLRNNEDLVSSEYLKYLLISDLYVQLINGSTFGAKMPRVSWEFMTNIKLLLPNLREQAELTSCLESLTREIDDRIKFINRKNKLLKEYRQSLISNVVTGKVKVINL